MDARTETETEMQVDMQDGDDDEDDGSVGGCTDGGNGDMGGRADGDDRENGEDGEDWCCNASAAAYKSGIGKHSHVAATNKSGSVFFEPPRLHNSGCLNSDVLNRLCVVAANESSGIF